ncbi:hypothetical protein CTAYLR_005802 [Chrysophaeum taylorii]|uniref:N-acetyltransferase domain-containing protein n=1 Tax=Chrysophaeum taylorii TaxID=2483200 RepID=A0AAD7XPH0_9STRA|nr:hypothetical protein CTAYLR_005802 [Chrysophaeum taylorii]
MSAMYCYAVITAPARRECGASAAPARRECGASAARAFSVRVEAGDLGAVTAVYFASYAHFCPAAYPQEVVATAVPIISQAQPALLEDPGFRVVEDESGRVIAAGGWTAATPGTGEVEEGRCHVRHVACHPEASRRGVGRLLLEALKRDAVSRGFREMDCYSTLNAVPFYEKMGFVVIEARTIPITPNLDFEAVWMRAIL